jgi:hypothetical protein
MEAVAAFLTSHAVPVYAEGAGAADIDDLMDDVPPLVSPAERYAELTRQLQAHPARALTRYGALLPVEMLAAFPASDFECSIILRRLRARVATASVPASSSSRVVTAPVTETTVSVVARNRRYRRLQELLAEGEYFSDDAMQARDFHLHHLYVGQYLTAEEQGHIQARHHAERYGVD